MTRSILLGLTLGVALAGCTPAPRPPAAMGEEASIPFLNHGGVDNWAADGDRIVYLQDSFRRWYRATLIAPCTELAFADRIGIETRGNDTLDRFGALLVRGQRCQIDSLVTSGPPPRLLKRHKDKADSAVDRR